MINKKVRRSENEATSAEIVASIDDILIQILFHLPIKSLVRFLSVSKHFLALIKNPHFSLKRNPNPNPALGLFLQRTAYQHNPTFEYVHFSKETPISPPFRNLEFLKESSGLRILKSCNGLLLCSSYQDRFWNRKNYFVCNPTTKDFMKLPKLAHESDVTTRIRGLSLVFDPSRSPEYMVISVCSPVREYNVHQIEIYSSFRKTWRKSGKPFVSNVEFDSGTCWNGSMHWISHNDEGFNHLCYSVDRELLSTIPTPPEWDEESEAMEVYLGESCEHLHLVQTTFPSGIKFNVYEMKRDCCGWFVKYQVDVGGVFMAYPWKMRVAYFDSYSYFVRSVVRSEREEDSFLVMEIPGKIICLNLAFHTFEEIWDFHDDDWKYLPSRWTKSFEYIESLCCV